MNEFYRPKKGFKYSKREVDFVLFNLALENSGSVYTGNDPIELPNNLKYLNDLEKKYEQIGLIVNNRQYFRAKQLLVDEDSLLWLKNDLRASILFYSLIYFSEYTILLDYRLYNDFLKDMIFSLDYSHTINVSNPQSYFDKDFLRLQKKYLVEYSFQYFKQNKTKNKYLNWLNRKDEEQLYWAIDYLEEKGLLINPLNFMPKNSKERFDQICASIDGCELHPDFTEKLNNLNPDELFSDEPELNQNNTINSKKDLKNPKHDPFSYGNEPKKSKKHLLKNMRMAWNQKVHRDKSKSNTKIKLPHGCNRLIKEIAKARGIDTNYCLKQILELEYLKINTPN